MEVNAHNIPGGALAAAISTTAVGNVGAGEDDLITYSLPGNTLNTNGRGIQITAWGIGANNANAKTLKLYFGTAVILTTALTASQVDNWHIVAEVVRTSSNNQKVVAQLVQGGTATLVDCEEGTATQTDTGALTIKCTGTATADNDIVHDGLIVKVLN